MNLLLAVLGVGFAAFCVWLGVRLVNRREKWAKWTAVGLVMAVFVLYPLSMPWAEAAIISAARSAVVRNEKLPGWVSDGATGIYTPLLYGLSVMPEIVLRPYQLYYDWSQKRAGVN